MRNDKWLSLSLEEVSWQIECARERETLITLRRRLRQWYVSAEILMWSKPCLLTIRSWLGRSEWVSHQCLAWRGGTAWCEHRQRLHSFVAVLWILVCLAQKLLSSGVPFVWLFPEERWKTLWKYLFYLFFITSLLIPYFTLLHRPTACARNH